MVAWGYVPTGSDIKNTFYRLIGHPHLIGRLRAKSVMRYLNTNAKKTIDIGCGEGAFCRELAQKGMKISGTDISKSAIKYARQAAKKIGAEPKFILGDVQFLPVKSGTFNQALCLDVLEHVPHPERVLEEVGRVIKKDGTFIVTVPNKLYLSKPLLPFDFTEHLKEIGHMSKGYEYDEIKEMLRKTGFEIEDHEYYYKSLSRALIEIIYHFIGSGRIKGSRKKMYNQNVAIMALFCLIYPVISLERVLPRKRKGGFLLVKAKKRR